MMGSIAPDAKQRGVCERRIRRFSIDACRGVACIASALFIKPFSGRARASAADHAMRSEARAAP
jgi:hypothetical protein